MNGNTRIHPSMICRKTEERNGIHQDTIHVTSSDMSSTNQIRCHCGIWEDRVPESLGTMSDPTVSITIDSHSH